MLVRMSRARARHARVAVLGALGVGLCGCMDDSATLSAAAPTTTTRVAARPGVSPRGAPVAFVSLQGAPDGVVTRLSLATLSAATKRDIATTDAPSAAYLARGYLTSWPTDEGTTFAVVWDIYDKGRHRAQRLDDQIVVRGQATDPWSLADERVLASLAASSADDLAATLSNTPEALAAAGGGAVVAMDPSPADNAAPVAANSYR